jgi:divalent metal cation (Fe/Co/Zn/Cd) transporter
VAWAALVGIGSLAAGVTTRSVVLVAFGLDSVIDGAASGTLVWRFRLDLEGTGRSDRAERIALRAVGVALLAVAAYVSAQAVGSLITGTRPQHRVVGLILLGASAVVLPTLGLIKLRLARQLQSLALRGDGVLSAAGGALAFIALLGLLLERSFGWSWPDPVAALLIALLMLREGWRALST